VSSPLPFLLVDLTKRGLEAHLQEVVLDAIMAEQVTKFRQTLRPILEAHVRSITLGHVEHVHDVLRLRDEIAVKVNVDFQDVQNGHPQEADA
jgi:hypothetical protein